MPPVTEIIYSKVSDEYTSGSASLVNVSDATGSHVGYETEDSTVLFWVNDWVTKDARDAFAEQIDYIAASRHVFDSELEPTVNYVEFEDTKGRLGAPITEFVTFTLKEGKNIDELRLLVQELHQKLAGTPKLHGDSWAPIIHKPNAYHGILGWDSVQAHWDAVSDGPLKQVIDQVKSVADLWLVHAAVNQVF